MDYERFFSEDTGNFFRSPVREIFKKVDLNEIYSFAGGYPDAAAFPLEDIGRVSAQVLDRYGAKALQYCATQGVPELRAAVARRYGVPVERVQVTTSSQQGIDVCTRVLADPGDVILTSNPSYLGALQSFRSYRAEIVGVPHMSSSAEIVSVPHMPSIAGVVSVQDCGCGALPSASSSPVPSVSPSTESSAAPVSSSVEGVSAQWEAAWRTAILSCISAGKRVKFLYMIPDFQNPSGETLSLEERKLLVSLAEEFDFLIVEDSPYRELRYEGESVPTLYSLAPSRVLHLGSLSKILAPGFRVGWIIAAPELLDRIYVCKQSLDLCSPSLDQYIAAELISSGLLDGNLHKSTALYRSKRDLLLSLLDKYMPAGVSWTRPEGGLFLYLSLPEGIDTVRLYDRALAAGVAYVAGSFFCTDGSGLNTMRLNFSFLSSERMEAGVRTLADVIRTAL